MSKKTPQSKTVRSRVQQTAPHLTVDPNFQLNGVLPTIISNPPVLNIIDEYLNQQQITPFFLSK